MKNAIISEILRNLNSNPNFKKKLKIFALVAGFGVITLGAAGIYATYAGAKYVAKLGSEVNVQAYAQTLKENAGALPTVAAPDCVSTALSLMNLDKLLNTSVSANFGTLKAACLKETIPQENEIKESEAI